MNLDEIRRFASAAKARAEKVIPPPLYKDIDFDLSTSQDFERALAEAKLQLIASDNRKLAEMVITLCDGMDFEMRELEFLRDVRNSQKSMIAKLLVTHERPRI